MILPEAQVWRAGKMSLSIRLSTMELFQDEIGKIEISELLFISNGEFTLVVGAGR